MKSKTEARRRLFLIDDHAVMRDGLKSLLKAEPDLMVCGEAANAKSAIAELQKAHADLVITDISMPGADGIELIKNLKAHFPKLQVMVLSMHDENLYAERVVRAGARGYIMKQASTDEVLKGVRAVLRGEIFLHSPASVELAKSLLDGAGQKQAMLARLSDREIEVFRSIGEGFTTREVASSLGVSSKTIESHRGNMRRKLDLKTGAELTRFALSHCRETL